MTIEEFWNSTDAGDYRTAKVLIPSTGHYLVLCGEFVETALVETDKVVRFSGLVKRETGPEGTFVWDHDLFVEYIVSVV